MPAANRAAAGRAARAGARIVVPPEPVNGDYVFDSPGEARELTEHAGGPDGYPLAGPVPADRPGPLVADGDLRQARDKAVGPRNDLHAGRRTDLDAT